MGTKNNPGTYDCYANAEPDEPMFVLLGRDKDAPDLVESWAAQREVDGESPDKLAEARALAREMREWRAKRSALEFTCPNCESHHFGSSMREDMTVNERICHGNCEPRHVHHVSHDYLYFTIGGLKFVSEEAFEAHLLKVTPYETVMGMVPGEDKPRLVE